MKELQNQIPASFSNETHEIFLSYKAILHDPVIVSSIRAWIFEKGATAGWAVAQAFSQFRSLLAKVNNVHIAEKANDLDSVKDLLLEVIVGNESTHYSDLSGCICATPILTPRDVLSLSRSKVEAIIAENGTRSSHVAILARNLNIPMVLGAENFCANVRANEMAIVDGSKGVIEVSPAAARIETCQHQIQAWQTYGKKLTEKSILPALTQNGDSVSVFANIESSEEIARLKENGADGVGLFRLEFFYLSRKTAPDEEEIFSELSALTTLLPEKEITVRLLDAGGDKEIPSLGIFSARTSASITQNPAMGLRGVRVLIRRPDVLAAQCRAIVRANHKGNIRILLPFVSSIEEVRAVRASLRQVWRELATTSEVPPPVPQVGMMVELPAAVAMAKLFAREVDFFSIGTNDLIQHTLAVDRTDPAVSHLYEGFHPAVLSFIKSIVAEAETAQIPVCLCGEMASDPLATELLLGLGLRKLSTNMHAMPSIKEIIRNLDVTEAESLAMEVLQIKSGEEIRNRLQSRFIQKFGPEMFSLLY